MIPNPKPVGDLTQQFHVVVEKQVKENRTTQRRGLGDDLSPPPTLTGTSPKETKRANIK